MRSKRPREQAPQLERERCRAVRAVRPLRAQPADSGPCCSFDQSSASRKLPYVTVGLWPTTACRHDLSRLQIALINNFPRAISPLLHRKSHLDPAARQAPFAIAQSAAIKDKRIASGSDEFVYPQRHAPMVASPRRRLAHATRMERTRRRSLHLFMRD